MSPVVLRKKHLHDRINELEQGMGMDLSTFSTPKRLFRAGRRNAPIPQLANDDLLTKAMVVACRPGDIAQLPAHERTQVEPVVTALQKASGWAGGSQSRPVQAAQLAQRTAAQLAPSSTLTPPEIEAALHAQGLDMVQPFAPGEPLRPFYGYSRRPRQMDYTVGRNLTTQPRSERIPFATLGQLYKSYDVAQICTRHSINDMRSMRIRITAMDGYEDNPVKEIAEAKRFLRRPDGTKTFRNWLAQNMLDLWRYDAAPIFRQRNKGGKLIALKNVSAPMIAPMVDYFGDTPTGDAPAFMQFVEGVPWDWLKSSDLIYEPFWPETESPYGTPPLETVLVNANTDLRLQLYFLQFFTTGQVPEAFAVAPEGQDTPDDLTEWQETYDDWTYGDQQSRWGLRWLPHDTQIINYKPQEFDPDVAEYVERRTVAAFGLTPQDLGILADVNRATSETQVDQQFRITSLPTTGYYEDILDEILQVDLDLPVQARFDTGREKEDRLMEAQAHQIYCSIGAESSDEVREVILGYPVDPENPIPRFWDSSRLGPVPLKWIRDVSGVVNPITYAPEGPVEPLEFVMVGQTDPDPSADGSSSGGGATPKGPSAPGAPVTAAQEKRYPEVKGGRSLPGTRHGGAVASGTAKEADDFATEEGDLAKWRRSARKAVGAGRSPRPFLDSEIGEHTYERVWSVLKAAETREEVDEAFAKAVVLPKV